MTPWDELTVVEQLQSQYSDFYKDVHGFRPRFASDEQWNSESWLSKQMDLLHEEWEVVAAREAEHEREAVAAFEVKVDAIIASGAKTRTKAIEWLMDAADADGDPEYMCFLSGLPYGYFKKAA